MEGMDMGARAYVLSAMRVMVTSVDGWMGAVAWRQLGAKHIYCVPLTPISRSQLVLVEKCLPGLTVIQPPLRLPEDCDIIVAHLTTELTSIAELETLSQNVAGLPWAPHIIAPGHRSQLRGVKELSSRLFQVPSEHWHQRQYRHHQIGGLTNCRMGIIWSSRLRSGKTRVTKLDPIPIVESTRTELRSPTAFLEVLPKSSACRKRTEAGTEKTVWRPFTKDEGSPLFPWPCTQDSEEVWIEAPATYHGPKVLVERTLTAKEKANILDLRPDLSRELVEAAWDWEGRGGMPTRFMTEFCLALAPALAQTHTKTSGQSWECWSGEQASPRIPISSTSPLALGGRSGLETLEYFAWVWDPTDAENVTVATKADSAKVDAELWTVGGTTKRHAKARETIRGFLHRLWRRHLTREVVDWLNVGSDPLEEDIEAARECVTRASNSTWWDWSDGSRLFFWRWPTLWLKEARDGAKPYHLKRPPRRLHFPNVPITEEWVIASDREKILKLLDRRYLESAEGMCWTTIPRFPVPKGLTDIRVVWDLSRNGVNVTIYTPSFFLPTVATLVRRIHSGDFQGDFDVGEQFHNFMLHISERKYCGVWIPDELVDEAAGRPKLMRWCRAPFGWTSSPYLTLRMLARAIEIAKGDLGDDDNPFGWTRVQENYPGSKHYDPSLPRIRLLKADGSTAAICFTFYDDGRVFGPSEDMTARATRQVCGGVQRLGIQDAARKRRLPSQRAGAWCGGVIHSDMDAPRKFISKEKWSKLRGIVRWIREHVDTGQAFDRQAFLQKRGFLVHVSMTYDHIKPYLKGLHLAAEAWRPDRDADGWPLDSPSVLASDKDPYASEIGEEDIEHEAVSQLAGNPLNPGSESNPLRPPLTVPVTEQIAADLEALRAFTETEHPVMVLIRPVRGNGPYSLAYGFGDASGEGFGSYISPSGERATVRHGFWCNHIAEQSSNYRELRNLVELVRTEVEAGKLRGREVWVFTDNLVAEYVFYKGASKTKTLTKLVTELRLLAIRGQFTLQVVHIAGTRMILQGTDALSRGELHLSLLTDPTGNTVPLHQTGIERNPGLVAWLRSWIRAEFTIAKPTDWFNGAHQTQSRTEGAQSQCWIWDLPPAGALDALEELGSARLKRHDLLLGVVLTPQLMRPEWYRRMTRVVDLYFVIPPGVFEDVWPSSMQEGLTVGLFFPLLRHRPWDWKSVVFMGALGGTLSRLHRIGDPRGRDLLREFWSARSWIADMPSHLVRDLLSATNWSKLLGVARRCTRKHNE